MIQVEMIRGWVESQEAVCATENDPARIAKSLGARYVMAGTVRRAADQLRVGVQLINAHSGHTLRANTFDRTFAGVFELQDEITRAIAAAIEPRLEVAEERRALSVPDEKLDAWDCSLRALWHVRKGTRDDYTQARRLLDWALVRDPRSSHAHSVLALCLFQEALLGWVEDPSRALAGTLRAARDAVALDDQDWLAHSLLGIASLWTLGDHDRALQEQDRALELNPSSAISHQLRACVLFFAGRPGEAVEGLDRVIRLEPRYQSRSMVLADRSLNHLLMGDVREAIELAQRALAEDPDNVRAHQRLVAALGYDGDREAMATAREALLSRQPGLRVAALAPTYPFARDEDT